MKDRDRGSEAGNLQARKNASGHSAPKVAPSVLLVEDNLSDALLVQALLDDELGYRVTLVQDGIQGCQLARHQRWDLVITDLNLPGRGGEEVIRTSQEAHPETPVLAITGFPKQAGAAREWGAEEVIYKPLQRDDVRDGVLSVGGASRNTSRSGEPASTERKVLAIGGLPGDVELGCGGILLGHKMYGHSITLLVLAAGGDDKGVEARKTEAERAADLLEADLLLPEDFGSEIPTRETINEWVRRAADKVKPEVIYAPSPRDVRASRMRIHRAAALCKSKVPRHYSYQAITSTLEFHPTLFVNVADQMDAKLRLLAEYRAKASFRPHLQEDVALASARYWGRFLGYTLAEPLELLGAGDRPAVDDDLRREGMPTPPT